MSTYSVRRSPVEIADEKVDIAQVCRWVGTYIPEGLSAKSWKTYCPLGETWHTDFGSSKTFRLYPDTNTAWCFAGCDRFTPSSLYARANGVSLLDASRELLDRIGYRPPTLAERWSQASEEEHPLDIAWLGLALRTYCERMKGTSWKTLQFEARVSGLLGGCLALLDMVESEADAEKWLRVSKEAMTTVLTGAEHEQPGHPAPGGLEHGSGSLGSPRGLPSGRAQDDRERQVQVH